MQRTKEVEKNKIISIKHKYGDDDTKTCRQKGVLPDS